MFPVLLGWLLFCPHWSYKAYEWSYHLEPFPVFPDALVCLPFGIVYYRDWVRCIRYFLLNRIIPHVYPLFSYFEGHARRFAPPRCCRHRLNPLYETINEVKKKTPGLGFFFLFCRTWAVFCRLEQNSGFRILTEQRHALNLNISGFGVFANFWIYLFSDIFKNIFHNYFIV